MCLDEDMKARNYDHVRIIPVVVQWLAQWPLVLEVSGSIPAAAGE